MPGVNDKAATGKRKDDASPDRAERIIFAVVIFVIATVPTLTFLFSFGNVGDLGVSLHVDRRIAYLTGPAIDLSVVGLIVAGSYLSHRGWSEKRLWPVHLMSVVCGLTMIALNCGQAVYESRWRLATFDAVGPLLLIGWGFVGPWLLRQLYDARLVPTTERQQVSGNAAEPAAPSPMPTESGSGNRTAIPATGIGSPAAAGGNGNGSRPATAPARSGKDPAADPSDFDGNWATLAAPLYRKYVEDHNGTTPTGPVLANLLRNAHRDLKVPESPRSERNIRKATEDLIELESGGSKAEDAEPERAWAVNS